jgi:CRISPR system Cascade subunit CasC
MTHNFLTVHSLTAIPLHNRNRDDRGQPKQLREGGAARGVLSSQSLKRIARVNYERAAASIGLDLNSVRSKSIPEAAVERAIAIAAAHNQQFDSAEALLRATETVALLTTNNAKAAVKLIAKATSDRDSHAKKAPADIDKVVYMEEYDRKVAEKESAAAEKGVKPAGKEVAVFVSADEIESLALALCASTDPIDPRSVFASQTGSLALAGFGRMTANAPDLKVEAGIAVSPAVTTHAIVVNIDYFTAVDDRGTTGPDGRKNDGAAHLDQAFHASGVYYRSATYDRAQLRKNWSGWDTSISTDLLEEFVRDLTLSLPQGRKNSSSADTLPNLLLAEQQRSRTGYQFQTPVQAQSDGYLEPSITELLAQAADARAFDSRNFGPAVLSGTSILRSNNTGTLDAPITDMSGLTSFIVDWLRA